MGGALEYGFSTNRGNVPLLKINAASQSIPLSKGNYQITFIFKNTLNATQSSSSVLAEGQAIISNLGGYVTDKNSPSFSVIKTVAVQDGSLDLSYTASLEDVKLAMFIKFLDQNLTPVANQLPEVSVKTAQSEYQEGEDITITANYSDQDGKVNKVEYFASGIKLGEVTPGVSSGSKDFLWKSVGQGEYTLYAKATDNVGESRISSTISILVQGPQDPSGSPSPSPSPIVSAEGVWQINFNAEAAYAASGWHNLSMLPTSGSSKKLISGDGSSIELVLESGWDGGNNKGYSSGSNSGVYPDAVMSTYYFTTGTERIRLRGLQAEGVYNFSFFASSMFGSDRTAVYSINGKSVSLNASFNESKVVSLNEVVADAKGELVLEVAKGSIARYGFLGAMIVEEVEVVVPNVLPAVAMSMEQLSYNEGEEIQLQATATDSDGSISELSFYVNDEVVGSTTTSENGMYSYVWQGALAGVYTVYARATDDAGENSTSASVSMTVNKVEKPSPSPIISAEGVWQINFNAEAAYAASGWNNLSMLPTSGSSKKLISGDGSSIELVLESGWDGGNNKGYSSGSDSGIYPDAVTSTYYYTTGKEQIRLRGLKAGGVYNFSFYASSMFGSDRTAVYSINGSSVSLNASFNESKVVSLSEIEVDARGELVIEVAKGSIARYGFLGAMIIEEVEVVVPNVLPAVAMSIEQLSYQEGEEILLQATATDSDGSISELSFYVNDEVAGSTTVIENELGSYAWQGAEAGTYTVYAKATDDAAESSTSAAVTITVNKVEEPTPAPAPVVSAEGVWQINFNTESADAASGWNNLSMLPTSGSSKKLISGDGSSVELVLESSWDGGNNKGYSSGSNSGVYPDAVMSTYYFTTGTEHIRLRGLQAEGVYNFSFFASSMFGSDRTAVYSINGKSVSLNASFNESKVVSLNEVVADAKGELVLEVAKGSNARYGFLGAMIIEEVKPASLPQPSKIQILAAGVVGDEEMSIRISGIEVKRWTSVGGDAKAGSFMSFVYEHSEAISSISDIQVVYNGGGSTNSDLRVDKIIVDGIEYETEAPDTYSTGTWERITGVEPGYKESEWLHSRGYFHYKHSSSTDLSSANLRTLSDTKLIETYSAFNVYPNPMKEHFYIQVPEYQQVVKVQLIDLNGILVFSESLSSGFDGKVYVDITTHNLSEGKYAVLVYLKSEEVLKTTILKDEL